VAEHPETDLMVFEPYEGDRELFDHPLIAYSLSYEVLRRGYRTTVKTILADFGTYAAVLGRHGIGVVSRAEFERRVQRWSREAHAEAGRPGADPAATRGAAGTPGIQGQGTAAVPTPG
jgi:hypothetical protein